MVRRKYLSLPGFDCKLNAHHIAYLEIPIHPNENGDYAFPPKFLIWPHPGFMMNAIPDKGNTFTASLVLPLKGEGVSFEALNTREKMAEFIKEKFPSAVPYIRFEEIDFT